MSFLAQIPLEMLSDTTSNLEHLCYLALLGWGGLVPVHQHPAHFVALHHHLGLLRLHLDMIEMNRLSNF